MATSRSMQIGMEEVMARDTLKAVLAELVAVAIFVFIGVGSVIVAGAGGGILGVAFAHGLAIAFLVGGIGPMSGGHINPAVTFAMVITGRISITRGVMYVVGQMIGACVGMALLFAFIDDSTVFGIPGAGGHGVNSDVLTNLGAVGVEATLTFVLVWTVFATAINPKGLAANLGSLAALAIGFAVLADHIVGIPLTGASMNPARTFGPQLLMGRWDDWWVYYVGPLIGAAIAGLSFTMLYLTGEKDT